MDARVKLKELKLFFSLSFSLNFFFLFDLCLIAIGSEMEKKLGEKSGAIEFLMVQ
jgi:hypothetical protein